MPESSTSRSGGAAASEPRFQHGRGRGDAPALLAPPAACTTRSAPAVVDRVLEPGQRRLPQDSADARLVDSGSPAARPPAPPRLSSVGPSEAARRRPERDRTLAGRRHQVGGRAALEPELLRQPRLQDRGRRARVEQQLVTRRSRRTPPARRPPTPTPRETGSSRRRRHGAVRAPATARRAREREPMGRSWLRPRGNPDLPTCLLPAAELPRTGERRIQR
jgi:hypothetical protein